MLRSLCFIACFFWIQCTPAFAQPPNFIVMMADDLGYGELGCFGQRIIRTPNIDKLATEGIRFTQFYCGSPVCAPSRCVLMTGLHGGHAFIRDNREHKPEGQLPIPDATVTIAEVLRGKGYSTAAIGKWGLGYPGSAGDPNRQGFDLFYGFNCQRHAHNHYPRYLWRNDVKEPLAGNTRSLTGEQHSQDLFIREAITFLRQHKDQPFFLYLPFAIPHLSIQADDEIVSEYRKTIPEDDYQHTAYLEHPYPRAGYAAMVTQMDRGIGEIMQTLTELRIDRRTLVMFTSDNGPTYDRLGGSDSAFFESTGPLRGLKGSVNEGGIRVPAVCRWPDVIQPATTNDHIGAFQDVLPTLAELADADVPNDIDGVSFASTLLGDRQQPKHEFLFWHFAGYGGQQAVRIGRWKAIRKNLKQNPNAEIQLFDLENDLRETRNVAAEHPEIIERVDQLISKSVSESTEFPLPTK